MSNRPLVVVGAALALAGLAVMILVLTQSAGPESAATSIPLESNDTGWPSYGWPIVAGITLAIGAACIMIGMNRWHQGAR